MSFFTAVMKLHKISTLRMFFVVVKLAGNFCAWNFCLFLLTVIVFQKADSCV